MQATFNCDDVYNFLKLLVEIGGVHYVDGTHSIKRKADDTPVGIKSAGGGGNKLIALYKENMEMDPNQVLLNPFTEVLGRFPEKDWFFGFMEILPGVLVKETIRAMATLATDKEKDAGFKTAAALGKFVGLIDNKFLNEVEKIRGVDIGIIYYAKDKHIAQLTSALWEKDFEDKMKTKIRKSSLNLLRDMVATLLSVERPEELLYTATLIGCPRFDATVHVLVDVLDRIDEVFEKVTNVELHAKELQEHLTHLEAYHKAIQWLASYSTGAAEKKDAPAQSILTPAAAPWHVAAPGETTQPTIAAPAAPATAPAVQLPTMTMTPVAPPAVNAGIHPVLPQFKAPVLPTLPTVPVATPGMMPMMTPGMAAPMTYGAYGMATPMMGMMTPVRPPMPMMGMTAGCPAFPTML